MDEGVGHFQISLPCGPSAYKFNDIANYDKVNIYYAYDTVGATPNFVGRIKSINGPLNSTDGYIRILSGFSQGEILQRRLKKAKIWNDVHACDGDGTPVHDIADDLSIYHVGDIDTVTNHVSLQVDSESYFDVLRKVSDYWVSAGTQLKYDFVVDVDGHLHWKARPWRTSGVDTYTVGKDIMAYSVIRNIDLVKNNITVYGEQGKVGVPGQNGRTEPSDMDAWTETTTDNWTATTGVLSLAGPGGAAVGSWQIQCQSGGGGNVCNFNRSIPTVAAFGIGAYQTLNFYHLTNFGPDVNVVRLYAPDSSNYFQAEVADSIGAAYGWRSYQLGQNQEYDAIKNPSGVWTKPVGSPNWANITAVAFYCDRPAAAIIEQIDGLYFGHGRFRYNTSDATSISNYGQSDLDRIYDNLTSDAQCESRAKTLLYQLKDEPIQLTVTTPGTTNTLIGDRVPMTIPQENINAANYDIITVENSLIAKGFITKATMVNSSSVRTTTPITIMDIVKQQNRQLRELGRMDRTVW